MGDTNGKHMAEDDGLFTVPDVSDIDEPDFEELGETNELSAARDEIPPELVPRYLLPNRVYDILKWVSIIVLPSLGLFVETVGTKVGYAGTGVIVTIILATGVFIGSCICASQASAMGR